MHQNLKFIIKLSSISLLSILILVYAYYQSRYLIKGVDILVSGITDGQTFTEDFIPIKGEARHAQSLTLNDREILVDQNGLWQENLILQDGYNTIKIVASDKFGKIKQKNYQVVYIDQ